MNCKTAKTRNLIGYIMIGIGVLVGVLAHFFNNTGHDVAYLYGIACGLISASLAIMIISFIRNKNPKYREQQIINEQDERNQMLSMRSASIAFTYLYYVVVICFLVNLFIPLAFHYIALFLIVSAPIVQMIAAHHYGKKY
ncbi:hypothetical protein PBV87_22520 [Niameybacter massiliensis]|uniref:DUF2178 domain-containing protein n=1 Tax=Holtiella tumoricola TaxID=3018743 RepID=A0AA42DT08_9FIRM|nr:hypothetical protein [Holtiella tumoricola]MDA3734248.1 hypothetical protein [Holtiella tumoricola]